MSTNRCDVPKEILNIVLLYVKANDKSKNKKDLSQCSLTCHGWSAPAQAVLFLEIHVDTTDNIDSLMLIALRKNELKNWVEALEYSKTCLCTTTTLLAVDSLFPNLETLNCFSNDLLYSFFCRMLTQNERFKNLKKLPLPTNKEQDAMYSQCLDFLKEHVTSITLFDDEANNREMYQDVIIKLDIFPKLRNVLVRTTDITDMQYQNLVKYITPLIENSSTLSLQELCITSTANDSYCFRLSTKGQGSLLSMVKMKNLNVYMYNEECCTVSQDLMLFIMHQCPNMNSLYVENRGKTHSCDSVSNYPSLFQFIVYLSKMPNFFLQKKRDIYRRSNTAYRGLLYHY